MLSNRYCCDRPISDTTYIILIVLWGVSSIILSGIGIVLMTLIKSHQIFGFLVLVGGLIVAITFTGYVWKCCGLRKVCCSNETYTEA